MAAAITDAPWDEMFQRAEILTVRLNNVEAHTTNAQAQITALESQQDELEISMQMFESEQTASKTRLEPATELLKKAGGKKSETLIDDKHMIKPAFDGTIPKKFRLWNFKFTNFVCGKFPHAETVLNWSRVPDNAISIAKAEAETKKIGSLAAVNTQLYAALANLLDSEPLSITMNTKDRNGLEVWRKLLQAPRPTNHKPHQGRNSPHLSYHSSDIGQAVPCH